MNINTNLMSINHTALKRSKKDIKYIVVHYVGALGDAKANTDYYKGQYVGASADFWVGFKGDIWQGNDYWNYYSWAIGGGLQGSGSHPFYQVALNSNSISVEMCVRKRSTNTMNATDRDWYFEDATVESAAELVAFLMKDTDVDIDHVIRHFDVNSKICPNPFVYDNGKTTWSGFKQKVMNYYNGNSAPAPQEVKYRIAREYKNGKYIDQKGAFYGSDLEKIKNDCPVGYSVFDAKGNIVYTNSSGSNSSTDKIWLGWTKYESGSKGFTCVNGDSGKAYGKYQFDYRYALVPFMQFCVDKDSNKYGQFKLYISYRAGDQRLVNNSSLAKIWTGICDKYPAEFEALQDTYAYKSYYLEVKKYLENLYGIKLDNHDPAVKGSAFSMAIRSGALTGAKKFNGCTDSTSDKNMLQTAYGTYGNEDAGRWPRQFNDALSALDNSTYTEIDIAGNSTPSPAPTPDKDLKYKVGQYVNCSSYYNKAADPVSKAVIKPLSGTITATKPKKANPYQIDGKYWCNDGDIRSVGKAFEPYNVKVNSGDVYIRSNAGTNYASKGFTGIGTFRIVEEKKDSLGRTWGLLKAYQKNKDGWIALWLDCVKKV